MATTGATAGDLFKAGALDDAIAAAGASVRAAPADAAPRLFLAELLLFAGNLERADTILDAAGQIDPAAALAMAEFRQLLRAEQARRQFHTEGRLPEFLDGPTVAMAALLAAHVAVRAGDLAQAAAYAAEAEAARPRCPGRHDEAPFADWRDADDLHAGVLDVLTTTGKYFWLPAERITEAVFHLPRRARDLFWRRATVSVEGGPDGDIYVPALYPSAGATAPLRLGRATDWAETGDLVQGIGQRLFLLGDEAVAAQALTTLRFAPA